MKKFWLEFELVELQGGFEVEFKGCFALSNVQIQRSKKCELRGKQNKKIVSKRYLLKEYY